MLNKFIIAAIFYFSFNSALFAQKPILSHQIGQFTNAEAFSISQNQFIYVTDTEKNEIYKLDLNGNVKKFIGGYGWSEGSFDNPVDIFATTLNVYVTDMNNDRVQFLDKDLNFISQFNSDRIENPQYHFRYPTDALISQLGDLFILDSDNSRILKFNLNGNFSLEIGNYDAGSFALNKPTKFDISSDLRLFVLDENTIIVFDQFGGGLNKLPINQDAVNLQIEDSFICLTYPDKIAVLNLKSPEKGFSNYFLDLYDSMKDSFVYKDQLFVLTEKTISIYNLPKQ